LFDRAASKEAALFIFNLAGAIIWTPKVPLEKTGHSIRKQNCRPLANFPSGYIPDSSDF